MQIVTSAANLRPLLLLTGDTREVMMMKPESLRESWRRSRAVGSAALVTGRYQHAACSKIEIFNLGDILKVCASRSCPNKGANWTLQKKIT
jgi:hypothetical protein